jgi:hypothetical protein
MTLYDILQIYLTSDHRDWHAVAAPLVPETSAHELLYVYKPNIAIVVAWNHREEERHTWSWVETFADHSAHNFYIDLLYDGVPVFRELAVSVDGGRANLPSPSGFVDNDEAKGWAIKRDEYEFVRQFSVVRGDAANFDDYFGRAERGANFVIV